MIDIREDQKQAKDWIENGKGEMSDEALVLLASQGHLDCGERYCGSREYCEDGMCYCIREVFPSFHHYDLYLRLRELFVKGLKIGIVDGLVDLSKSEKYSEGRRKNNENRSD